MQMGNYWGSRGQNESFWGKGEGKVHPSRHIYYLIILGRRDYMDSDDKVFLRDIGIDSWCIVGVGGAT